MYLYATCMMSNRVFIILYYIMICQHSNHADCTYQKNQKNFSSFPVYDKSILPNIIRYPIGPPWSRTRTYRRVALLVGATRWPDISRFIIHPGARARSCCGERIVTRKKYWKRGGLSKSVARTPAACAANGKRTAKNTGKYGGD